MSAGPVPRWWREASPEARRALFGAGAGWMLDAMDVMLYAFALGTIQKEFGLTSAGAGALASVTLVASSVGGIAIGALEDRFGRARMLKVSILVYSPFTALTATSHSVAELCAVARAGRDRPRRRMVRGIDPPIAATDMQRLRRILKWCLLLLPTLVLLAPLGATAVWSCFRASLPKLDRRVPLRGLQAAVTVERDALGVPTTKAAWRLDTARATGLLHAQDRYFQMDLTRRASAGELAALLGPGLIEADRHLRQHRFRSVAQQVVRSLPAEDRVLMEAYVEGVNAGLKSLNARPPEYFLLRCRPDAWRLEDSE